MEGWQPISTAPKDGTPIAALRTLRWSAYKPNSEQAKRGIKGRWQESNGYGGWNNCIEPPTHWLPNPPLMSEEG